eukprot:c26635_g1_i1.p1 GENE.c26635_g1_i1~~c26635_g1_i1.p1  ORF type:complete len:173 (-),score=33.57 c26635_g1_i1:98-616(-)
MCGLGAGAAEALLWTTPSERIKVLQQTATIKNNKVPSVLTVIRETGVSRVYVGAMATTLRQSSSVAVRFATADHIKRLFPADHTMPPVFVSFISGGIGGALSVILNNPIDVIKSRQQAGASGSMLQVGRAVLAQKGMWGFTSGLSARIPRLFVSQAIQFAVVDEALAWLSKK